MQSMARGSKKSTTRAATSPRGDGYCRPQPMDSRSTLFRGAEKPGLAHPVERGVAADEDAAVVPLVPAVAVDVQRPRGATWLSR